MFGFGLPLTEQRWRPMPYWVYALALAAPTAILAAAAAQPWVPVADLLRDPLAVAQLSTQCCHSYYGALSNLGVLVWCTTAAICLFAALLVFNARGWSQDSRFLAAAGVVTGVLTLDDLYLLHDHVLPNYGVPDLAMYSAYGLLCLGFFLRFRDTIAKHDPVALLLAGAFLALSIVVDSLVHSDTSTRILIEDGAKLYGISLWAAFYITAALRLCLEARSLAATGSGRP